MNFKRNPLLEVINDKNKSGLEILHEINSRQVLAELNEDVLGVIKIGIHEGGLECCEDLYIKYDDMSKFNKSFYSKSNHIKHYVTKKIENEIKSFSKSKKVVLILTRISNERRQLLKSVLELVNKSGAIPILMGAIVKDNNVLESRQDKERLQSYLSEIMSLAKSLYIIHPNSLNNISDEIYSFLDLINSKLTNNSSLQYDKLDSFLPEGIIVSSSFENLTSYNDIRKLENRVSIFKKQNSEKYVLLIRSNINSDLLKIRKMLKQYDNLSNKILKFAISRNMDLESINVSLYLQNLNIDSLYNIEALSNSYSVNESVYIGKININKYKKRQSPKIISLSESENAHKVKFKLKDGELILAKGSVKSLRLVCPLPIVSKKRDNLVNIIEAKTSKKSKSKLFYTPTKYKKIKIKKFRQFY